MLEVRLRVSGSSPEVQVTAFQVPPVLQGDAGGARDDLIHGAGGDDTLVPGQGNDEVWGDAGEDTVVLAGNRADFALMDYSEDLTEVVLFDGFYTKELRHVERLRFDDGEVSLADFVGN